MHRPQSGNLHKIVMEGSPHETLFRRLQGLAREKQDLEHKMQDWESDYQALRQVEDSIMQAYASLSL